MPIEPPTRWSTFSCGVASESSERSSDAKAAAIAGMNAKPMPIPRTSIAGKTDPEIEQLLSEILYYTPTAHCGDRLASLLMAVHGAKQGSIRIEQGRLDLMRR